MVSSLGEKAFTDREHPTVHNRIVEMYHAGTDKESQVRVANGIVEPKSSLRCVVATIAFGMGINLPDVEFVFHWGASADIMSYWQEVGRCARDGRQGKAMLFIFPRSLDKRRVDEKFRQLIENVRSKSNCLRRGILEHLFLPEMRKVELEAACLNSVCCSACKQV